MLLAEKFDDEKDEERGKPTEEDWNWSISQKGSGNGIVRRSSSLVNLVGVWDERN
jgi:hypothetical protein